MSPAQTYDDESLTKYQLSIRTTVPINSIACARTAETNSRLRRTFGRLCTFHNSKFGGETKLTTGTFIDKESADTIADVTAIVANVDDRQRETQPNEFTNNGIAMHNTCNNNKRNSVDYYV